MKKFSKEIFRDIVEIDRKFIKKNFSIQNSTQQKKTI